MKKVLLATTAVAAFVAFSGAAQAQDPGRPDFGATEGGGGAGSAFTVKTSGAIKAYLKYASAKDESPDKDERNSGLFTLINAELEINGAATTDNGTDIETHIDFNFSGNAADESSTTATANIGGQEQSINLNNFAVIDELSLKISGNWGSVELGSNDGAEDTFKIYGGTVGAGTGGVDGDHHHVNRGVGKRFDTKGLTVGGTAGSGDSGDALKVTYLSPVFVGIQTGLSVAYATEGPDDTDTGVLGIGFGIKYSGSAGGFDYAASFVWGDTSITVGGDKSGDIAAANGLGGIGIGVKLGGAGVSGVLGVTLDNVGKTEDVVAADGISISEEVVTPDLYISPGVAYAIPGGKANVSLTAALALPEAKELGSYLIMVSADYAVLPGVTLAVDLGYGDADVANRAGTGVSDVASVTETDSGGFTGVFRAKAAF